MGLSNRQAARAIGVSLRCFYNWLRAGYIVPPPVSKQGNRPVRLWTPEYMRRLRNWKAKHFGEGVGRPPKKSKKVPRKQKGRASTRPGKVTTCHLQL